jgi:hypothetical protein
VCPDCHVPLIEEPPQPADTAAAAAADHEQLDFDFADWPRLWRDALDLLLRGADIAHVWTSPTSLVVPRQRREEIEDFIEYVEGNDAPLSPDEHGSEPAIQPYQRDDSTPWATFRGDLRASARAWKTAPGLVVTTGSLLVVEYALGAASVSSAWFFVPIIAVNILAAGFSGTQRIWYLRAFNNERLRASELSPLTTAFLGRFIRLGIVTSLAGIPITTAFTIAAGHTGLVIGSVIWWLVIDFALTFVTPALAFTTHSVRGAFAIGRRMIVDTWPTSRWYVFTPGLAVAALVWTRPLAIIGAWGAAGIGIGGGMLALWFKGAIAAYYLRRYPETNPDGAVYDDVALDL